MATNILMPALSPTMTEGTLARWLKKEGETVKSGDVIAEIETDKATMEVEAVDEGVLGRILVSDGTEGVKVNAPIAVLVEPGEEVPAEAPAAPPPAPAAAQAAPPARRPGTGAPGSAPAGPGRTRQRPRRRGGRAHLRLPPRPPHGAPGRARPRRAERQRPARADRESGYRGGAAGRAARPPPPPPRRRAPRRPRPPSPRRTASCPTARCAR